MPHHLWWCTAQRCPWQGLAGELDPTWVAAESLAFSPSLLISGGELELWLVTSGHKIATWPWPVSRGQQWMASVESGPMSPSNWAWPAGSFSTRGGILGQIEHVHIKTHQLAMCNNIAIQEINVTMH